MSDPQPPNNSKENPELTNKEVSNILSKRFFYYPSFKILKKGATNQEKWVRKARFMWVL